MIRWKTSTLEFNQCSRKVSWFKRDRMYCMDIQLPATKTLRFQSNGCVTYLDEYEEKDEQPPKGIESYKDGCKGDSGSGQFISNERSGMGAKFRYVQIAVYTTGTGDQFVDNKGNAHTVPCGSYSYNAVESRRLNVPKVQVKCPKGPNLLCPGTKKRAYLRSFSMSESTTYADTLHWIKSRTNLSPKDSNNDACTIS